MQDDDGDDYSIWVKLLLQHLVCKQLGEGNLIIFVLPQSPFKC